MTLLVAALLLLLAGFLGVSIKTIDMQGEFQKQTVLDLQRYIEQDYKAHFYQIDESDNPDFMGYASLQDYCNEKSLVCKDQFGNWQWQIQIIPNGLYQYRQITVFSGAGRELFRVSGLPYWAEYMNRVDYVVGVFCTNLYNYYKSMSDKAGADLNWYAISGGACNYDGGVNQVTRGTVTISKQIRCTDGWMDVFNAGATVVGGLFRLETGTIEIKNTNDIYVNECKDAGLTGMSPPYAVAVRMHILKNNYYEVCCGY